MSMALIVQTNDRIWLSSDSAISSINEGKRYRVSDRGKKIFEIDKYLIFCAGEMGKVVMLMNILNQKKNIKLKEIISTVQQNLKINDKIDIAIAYMKNGKSKLVQISPYENFNPIFRECKVGEIGVYTSGIHTQKANDIAISLFNEGTELRELYKKVYNELSSEEIGGELSVHELNEEGKKLFLKTKIKERNINYLTEERMDKYFVFAERLVGRLILGNKLMISDDRGLFTIEGNLLTVKDSTGSVRVKLGEYSTGKYGLQITSKKGVVLLSEDGIIQTNNMVMADNVESGYPLRISFYMPEELLSVQQVRLSFTLEKFRAYSRGAASEVIQLYSTASGGGDYAVTSTEPSVTRTSTPFTGYEAPTQTDTTYTQSGGHNHGVREGSRLKLDASDPYWPNGWVQFSPSGNHTHLVRLQSHTHDVTIPSHYHILNLPYHSHSISMPSHRHNIEYGMYESTSASGVRIIVNGTYVGGSYGTSQSSIDLTPYVQRSGLHVIELTSNQLGRISANIFTKFFLGS